MNEKSSDPVITVSDVVEEAAVAVEQAASSFEDNPDAVVEQIVKKKSPIELRNSTTSSDLPKAVAEELNLEFDSLLKEFVTNANLSSIFSELNPTTQPAGSASGSSSTAAGSKKSTTGGNIYGRQKYPNLRPTPASEPYSKQELFLRREHQAKVLGGLGSLVQNVYRPHEDILRPPTPAQTTLETLLAAGAHLGHSTSMFRPTTQPFIYGVRDGIHIIDLEQTLVHLRRAAKVIEQVAEQGGLILYVGTRPGQQRSLEAAANRSGGYYVHRRWVPGTLTNCREISQLWERVEVDMGDASTDRLLSPRLKRSLVKPDLVVLLNPVENRNAIYECIQSNVPTIGVVDTDSEPSLITYPIPGNDDSLRATDIFVGVLSKAAQKGRNRRLKGFAQYSAEQQRIKSTSTEASAAQ